MGEPGRLINQSRRIVFDALINPSRLIVSRVAGSAVEKPREGVRPPIRFEAKVLTVASDTPTKNFCAKVLRHG